MIEIEMNKYVPAPLRLGEARVIFTFGEESCRTDAPNFGTNFSEITQGHTTTACSFISICIENVRDSLLDIFRMGMVAETCFGEIVL